MLDGIAQELAGLRDVQWGIARSVDDRVPFLALQAVQRARVAVAPDLLEVGEQLGVRASAVEESDFPPGCQGRSDDWGAEEARSTEDQEPALPGLQAGCHDRSAQGQRDAGAEEVPTGGIWGHVPAYEPGRSRGGPY